MKKYIIFMALVLFGFSDIYTQTRSNPPVLPIVNNDIFKRDTSVFLRGWNWDNTHKNLNEAMGMNSHHRTVVYWNCTQDFLHRYSKNTLLIPCYDKFGHADRQAGLLQAISIQFDPEEFFYYNTADTLYHTFQANTTDTTGAVFGFRNISNIVDTLGNDVLLYKDSITNNTPLLVFSDPFPNDELIGLRDIDSCVYDHVNGIKDTLMNGFQFYISLHLRALEQVDTLAINDTILTIKIPYKYRIALGDSVGSFNTTYAYIDSVPNPILADQLDRGRRQPLRSPLLSDTSMNYPQEFVITKRMLANMPNMSTDSSYVTISAFFKLDSAYRKDVVTEIIYNWKTKTNDTIYAILRYEDRINSGKYNLPLQTTEHKGNKKLHKIESLGLEVYYHGNCDIAIDWLRFETPHSRKLFWGELDDTISTAISELIGLINSINTMDTINLNKKIYRLFTIDEFWVQNWRSQRYYNKLVGGLAISEIDHPVLQNQFEHCVDFSVFWHGSTLFYWYNVAAPFIKDAGRYWYNVNTPENNSPFVSQNCKDIIPNVFNYQSGYKGFWKLDTLHDHIRDTLNSEYETFLVEGILLKNNIDTNIKEISLNYKNLDQSNSNYYLFENDYSRYWGAIDHPFYYNREGTVSVQYNLENTLYNSFCKNNSFLYSSHNWFANIWASLGGFVNTIGGDTVNMYHKSGSRAITGEELRLQVSLPILLGAKGLYYWHGSYGEDFYYLGLSNCPHDTAREYLDTLKGNDLMFSKKITGDYIRYPDPIGLDSWVKPDSIDYSTLGIVDSSRIYIGTASVRNEIAKIHRWLSVVDTTLLHLRLASWYGKGYTKMYSQHKSFESDTILKDYIDITGITTYPLRRLLDGDTLSEQAHGIDSGFYDITLLYDDRYLRDGNLNEYPDSVYYIGVQNRRTDPLIYEDRCNRLHFFSTAEFDSLCRIISFDSTNASISRTSGTIPYDEFSTDNNPTNGDNSSFQPTYTEPCDQPYYWKRYLWWGHYWWKRLGCREIRIPIKFPQHTKDSASIVKVTELGVGTALDTLPYRHKDYYYGIDTSFVVTDNSPQELILRFLPGEGKILKVEFTTPSIKFEGNLEFSNQHKLVCYPTELDSNGNYVKYRYHAVYMNVDKNQVYYRRSHEMDRNFPNREIDWENREILISDTNKRVRYLYKDADPLTGDTVAYVGNKLLSSYEHTRFAYPSIVVRPNYIDTMERNLLNNPYVYIVFQGDNNRGDMNIYEAKFYANKPEPAAYFTELVDLRKTRVYFGINYCETENRYGTPVINASADFNYYAWSEGYEEDWLEPITLAEGTSTGIVYAKKSYDADFLEAPKYLGEKYREFNCKDPYRVRGRCFHPSLNNYSSIDSGENACVLVWQGLDYDTDTTSFNIYYTCIDGSDSIGIPDIDISPNIGNVVSNGFMAKLSNYSVPLDSMQHVSHRFPVVYQGVELGVSKEKIFQTIVWEVQDTLNPNKRVISERIIYIYKMPPYTGWLTPYPFYYISSEYLGLEKPYVSQGTVDPSYNNNTDTVECSDTKAVNLSISNYHITHGYWNLYNSFLDTTLNLSTTDHQLVRLLKKHGSYTHLSNLPFVKLPADFHLNRRIFQEGSELNSTGEIFLKRHYDTEDSYLPMFGFTEGINSTKVSDFLLHKNEYVDEKISMNMFSETNSGYYPLDTILSECFQIDNNELSFIVKQNANINLLNFELEEMNTSRRFPVIFNEINDNAHCIVRLNLLNGSNNYYRLRITKNNAKSLYSEDLYLGGIKGVIEQNSSNSLYKTHNEFIYSIDLGSAADNNEFAIFPNPAYNKLFVRLPKLSTANNTLVSKVYNILGKLVLECGLRDNTLNTIDISNLISGNYYLEIYSFDLETYKYNIFRKPFTVRK